MAQMASGNDGSRTYSYTHTETYTLEEAILKAIDGSFDPSEIYKQGQPQLKKLIEYLSLQVFSKQFSELVNTQQREIMKKLLSEIKKEKEQTKKPFTILDAMQMAKEGSIDDIELYQGLPDDIREIFDAISMSYRALNFKDLIPEFRKEILGIILELLKKSMDEAAKQKLQKEVEQIAQLEVKLNVQKKAKNEE